MKNSERKWSQFITDKYNLFIDEIGNHSKQLIFLGSASAFLVSLIAIVFGASAGALEKYLRLEEKYNYEFKSISDVIKFPLEQKEILDDKEAQFQLVETDSSQIKQFQIYDASVRNCDSYPEVRANLKDLILNAKNTLNLRQHYSVMSLWCLAVHYMRNDQKLNLGELLKEEVWVYKPSCSSNEYEQTFLRYDINSAKNGIDDFEKLIEMDCNDYNDSFLEIIQGLSKRLGPWNADTHYEVHIHSHFNLQEDSLNIEFESLKRVLLQSQRVYRGQIKFNLIRYPVTKGSDNSHRVIELIFKIFPGSKIIADYKRSFRPLKAEDLRSIGMRPYSQKGKLKLASRLVLNSTNMLSSSGMETSAKFSLPDGKYRFSFINADSSVVERLSITPKYASDPYSKAYLNDEFYDVELSKPWRVIYNSSNGPDYLGDIEIESLDKLSAKRFSLWQFPLLSYSTIGFMDYVIFAIYVLFYSALYVLIRIFVKRNQALIITALFALIISTSVTSLLSLIALVLDSFLGEFWQAYAFLAFILFVFIIIRKVEVRMINSKRSKP